MRADMVRSDGRRARAVLPRRVEPCLFCRRSSGRVKPATREYRRRARARASATRSGSLGRARPMRPAGQARHAFDATCSARVPVLAAASRGEDAPGIGMMIWCARSQQIRDRGMISPRRDRAGNAGQRAAERKHSSPRRCRAKARSQMPAHLRKLLASARRSAAATSARSSRRAEGAVPRRCARASAPAYRESAARTRPKSMAAAVKRHLRAFRIVKRENRGLGERVALAARSPGGRDCHRALSDGRRMSLRQPAAHSHRTARRRIIAGNAGNDASGCST